MEEQRKEEARQAVAAVEAAESAAVLEAFNQIFNGGGNNSNALPGVLGEVVVKTDAGPVKVAALSLEALAEAGEPAKIGAGKDSRAEVEVDAGAGLVRIFAVVHSTKKLSHLKSWSVSWQSCKHELYKVYIVELSLLKM